MKATPENKVKLTVKNLLSKYKCFWYPAVAGPYSVGGIPDFVGCYKGKFFGVEVKRPGGKPTALQLRQRDSIIEAGEGAWFLVDGEESLNIFRGWLDEQ